MAEAFRMDSPAEQAERRRKQLIAVVAHLVVTRGVAEVSHASVAKVAGCARSLVYRYFPRQEDLLYSLLSAFSEELGRRMTLDDEIAGVLGLAAVRPGSIPLATQQLFNRLWQPEDWERPQLQFRLACVILMRDSNLRSVLGAHNRELQDSVARHLEHPLTTLGLRPIEVAIFIDSMLSVMDHVIRAAWAGEITHDEAAHLSAAVNSRVLQTFVEPVE
jgi:AcrR family transcriptional regulator